MNVGYSYYRVYINIIHSFNILRGLSGTCFVCFVSSKNAVVFLLINELDIIFRVDYLFL